MKYQVRIFLNRNNSRELRCELVKYGFAIYKENRKLNKLEIDEDETIEFEPSVEEYNGQTSDSDNVFDCFLNTDSDETYYQISELIKENKKLVYSFIVNYASDDSWRIR